MPEEWLELAYINFDKAILHGRVTAGYDEYRCRIEREVEQVLTDEQKKAVQNLEIKQGMAMAKLLRSFVAEPA